MFVYCIHIVLKISNHRLFLGAAVRATNISLSWIFKSLSATAFAPATTNVIAANINMDL